MPVDERSFAAQMALAIVMGPVTEAFVDTLIHRERFRSASADRPYRFIHPTGEGKFRPNHVMEALELAFNIPGPQLMCVLLAMATATRKPCATSSSSPETHGERAGHHALPASVIASFWYLRVNVPLRPRPARMVWMFGTRDDVQCKPRQDLRRHFCSDFTVYITVCWLGLCFGVCCILYMCNVMESTTHIFHTAIEHLAKPVYLLSHASSPSRGTPSVASSPYPFSPTFDEADDSSWRGLSLHFTVLGIEKYIERGVPGAYLRFEARFSCACLTAQCIHCCSGERQWPRRTRPARKP